MCCSDALQIRLHHPLMAHDDPRARHLLPPPAARYLMGNGGGKGVLMRSPLKLGWVVAGSGGEFGSGHQR